jgi:hypothetical protein
VKPRSAAFRLPDFIEPMQAKLVDSIPVGAWIYEINRRLPRFVKHVGTWPHAMEAGPKVIDVYWMTLLRAAWVSQSAAAGHIDVLSVL